MEVRAREVNSVFRPGIADLGIWAVDFPAPESGWIEFAQGAFLWGGGDCGGGVFKMSMGKGTWAK